METQEKELDPRLLDFVEQIADRSGFSVVVEDHKIVVGRSPNCAVISVGESDNKIWVSFHRECHPYSVVTILVVLLDTLEISDLRFIGCFLSDVHGVMTYESEPGFDLLHVQYMRDLLGVRSKHIFVA